MRANENTHIDALGMDFKQLNRTIKAAAGDVVIQDCYGQPFLGAGLEGKDIVINGTPGNALGAYLDGAHITVNGNAQDAVGDTMNDGKIIINGNAGDALGYAMRGGKIFVLGNAGYRTGIHMKEFQDKKPIIVVGGKAGSFLGEYLAGGLIIVLGMGTEGVPVGNFTGTGMHGGSIFIRWNSQLPSSDLAGDDRLDSRRPPANGDESNPIAAEARDGDSAEAILGNKPKNSLPIVPEQLKKLPRQVAAELAVGEDLAEIAPVLQEYACCFNLDPQELLKGSFYKLSPNAKNPYKQLYTAN